MRARGDSTEASAALEALCRTYRPAVLAYIRARGYSAASAEDYAQAFFLEFIEDAWHANADPARGRFRTYLLTVLKRYMISAELSAKTAKRGGAAQVETVDDCASELVSNEPTPEHAFDRAWAIAILRKAIGRLQEEAAHVGKERLFDVVREFLVEPPDESEYARASEQLAMRRNTLAVAVHRLRRRLLDLVQAEMRETTASDADYQRETLELGSALGGLERRSSDARAAGL